MFVGSWLDFFTIKKVLLIWWEQHQTDQPPPQQHVFPSLPGQGSKSLLLCLKPLNYLEMATGHPTIIALFS